MFFVFFFLFLDGNSKQKMSIGGASKFLKQVAEPFWSVAKAKSMALKTKGSALRSRLIIFSWLRNKKIVMASLTHKLKTLMGTSEEGTSEAMVLHNESLSEPSSTELLEDEDDDKYPDLTHSLFDGNDGFEDPGGSVIDAVRNSKEEFKLEEQIDQVADLFIKRFHRQMLMQKQLSFKMYQEMLQRSL